MAHPARRVRVVLTSPAFLPLLSVSTAAAPVLAQLGVAAFFVPGTTTLVLGNSAGWFVVAMVVLAVFARAIDIESWAHLLPGGFAGRVRQAFGLRAVPAATSVVFVERLLLGAIACVAVGHYAVALLTSAGRQFSGHVRPEDLATLVAVAVIGVLWFRVRIGREPDRDVLARGIWIGIAILVIAVIWGTVTVARGQGAAAAALSPLPTARAVTGWPLVDVVLVALIAMALALPAIGGGESLSRAAYEFPAPRVNALRRTAVLSLLFALLITAGGTFLFTMLVPPAERSPWLDAPLVAIVHHLAAPAWMRYVLALGVVASAVLILVPAAHAALADAEQTLHRASANGTLPLGFDLLHTRFGTPSRAVDVSAASVIIAILTSGGRIPWLAAPMPSAWRRCWCSLSSPSSASGGRVAVNRTT